jgi:ribosomal-protein-alanine N-acetyltransferase
MNSGGFELIPAAQVHAEVLAGLHKVCFAAPWSARSMAEVLAMPAAGGLIAVGDGETPRPAGLVLWSRVMDEAEILTIAVLPPWRRRGLGGVLLRTAMDATAAAGAASLHLEVAADNDAALALYLRHGFERTGLRKGYYGGTDAITMRRECQSILSHDQ